MTDVPSRTVRSARRTRALAAVGIVGAVLVLAACAPGANELAGSAAPDGAGPYGFWWGLWHGAIAPITFVVSLFSDTVGVYEAHNTGGWYDFGFLIGISASLGGSSGGAAARRRRG